MFRAIPVGLWCFMVLAMPILLRSAPQDHLSGKTLRAKPNILVILADDMGYGDLGCYGSLQIETPNLDRMASNGIRCTQGYVSGAVCAPSRAGFLTGRYQQRFGFEHNLSALDKDHVPDQMGIPIAQPLISDRLKAVGYRTGLIGKWHVGEAIPSMLPNQRGFDYFFGMHNGSHPYFPTAEKNHLWRNGEPISKIEVPYLTDWFTDEALQFMQKGPQSDQPWFLYLSYNTPHTPLQAKPEDLQHYKHVPHQGRATYAAMQTCMDRNIGRILESLAESDQLENTLIVFFSDNGGSVTSSQACNSPLNGMKGSFLEGGIRVPFIFHWLAELPSGKTYDQPFIALDLLPTFLAAAGEALPMEFSGKGNRKKKVIYDGVDLLPFLKSSEDEIQSRSPHSDLFWRMALRGAAVRSGDWKLIVNVHTEPMLFDLAADPSEQTNLYAEQPERVHRLWEKLNQWEFSLEDTPHWLEAPQWQQYNRGLYTQPYNLQQPQPDQWPTPWVEAK